MDYKNNRGRDFKRGGFGGHKGGGSRFGGGFGGGNREMTMHEAVCADCHKPCQVPFRPTNDRPVYCRDCFAKHGGPEKSRFNDAPRKDFGGNSRPQFSSQPQPNSNVASSFPNKNNDEIKKQLEVIGAKLDNLIKIMTDSSKAETKTEPQPEMKKAAAKVIKSKAKAKKAK